MSLDGLTLSVGSTETDDPPDFETSLVKLTTVVGPGEEVPTSGDLSVDIGGDTVTLVAPTPAGFVNYYNFVGIIIADTQGVLPDIGGITILANDFGYYPARTTIDANSIAINIAGLTTFVHDAKLQLRLEITPSDVALSSQSVLENDAGAVIGDLTVTDLNDGDTHTLTVDDSRFEIVADQLKLKAGISLDAETEPSVDVTVTATDSFGLKYDKVLTIAVGNVNEGASGADKTISMKEDTAHHFKEGNFGFSDTDGDALAAVIIDTLPGSGSLKLDGAAVTAGQSIAAAEIGHLSWQPDKDAYGVGLPPSPSG